MREGSERIEAYEKEMRGLRPMREGNERIEPMREGNERIGVYERRK